MRVLHLTLKKKWFDMILSGEKKEEYRDINDYWWIRLVQCGETCGGYNFGIYTLPKSQWRMIMAKEFDVIEFKNGYGKQSPTMIVQFKGIKIGTGNPEWGCDGNNKFVIELGNIISTANIKDAKETMV